MKKPFRSHLFEKLPQWLSTDLLAAIRHERTWKSFESNEASFAIALTRARWSKGPFRICRSSLGPVLVPSGLHRYVRRYRVLHVVESNKEMRVDRVLTWVAFKKLLRARDFQEKIWHKLPRFVNTGILKRTSAMLGVRNEDYWTNT